MKTRITASALFLTCILFPLEILSVCGDWFGANVHISDGMRKHDDVIFTTYRVVGSKAIQSHGLTLPAEIAGATNEKLAALPEDDRDGGEPTANSVSG